ncbi:fimbrial protein [Edaphovirga cremea]|uniref:fimbrial protein n=1 Tax=Edaphovirga cremea TaxID=2267246 RepID=UPI00398A4964
MRKASTIKNVFYVATLLIFIITHKAAAVDPTLNFRGTVKQGSCIATVNDVDMGSIAKNEFTAVGVSKGEKEFSIELKNCTGVDIAVVTMSGNVDQNNNSLFALTQTGNYATGVALRIRTKDDQLQVPSGTQSNWAVASASSYSLKYKADYVQTLASVTTGKANVVAQFNISYR